MAKYFTSCQQKGKKESLWDKGVLLIELLWENARLHANLILGLRKLLLDSLVELFEGHSHDRRTLIDRAHDWLDDAG